MFVEYRRTETKRKRKRERKKKNKIGEESVCVQCGRDRQNVCVNDVITFEPQFAKRSARGVPRYDVSEWSLHALSAYESRNYD